MSKIELHPLFMLTVSDHHARISLGSRCVVTKEL